MHRTVQPPPLDRPMAHSVTHHITTTGPLVSPRPRLSPEHLRIARKEFYNMLELGIIHPSSRCWASPLHMVPKQTPGDWRPCGDYRTLNGNTVPDYYPVPHNSGFRSQPTWHHNLLKIDLVWAYHQILVEPQDIPKTAVTTPFGLF